MLFCGGIFKGWGFDELTEMSKIGKIKECETTFCCLGAFRGGCEWGS